MNLENRSGMLYARYKNDNKVWVRKALKMEDTPENREYALTKILPKLKAQSKIKTPDRPKRLKFYLDIVLSRTEARRKPATLKSYENAARVILDFFGDATIDVLRMRDIDEFAEEMEALEYTAGTIAVYMAVLKLAFKEAIRQDAVEKNYAALAILPQKKPKEKRPFTPEEVQKLLAANGELKTFLHLAFYTGARVNEILALRWQDYDGQTLKVLRTKTAFGYNAPKNGKTRTIPVAGALKKYLDALEQTGELIVKVRNCERVWSVFLTLQKSLGIEPRTTHTTRHTVASMMMAAGENPILIKEMLGWFDMSMLQNVYGHHVSTSKDFVGFEQMIGA